MNSFWGSFRRPVLIVVLVVLVAALIYGARVAMRELEQSPEQSPADPTTLLAGVECEQGKPGSNNHIAKAPPALLADCTDMPWGSAETQADTFFYITRDMPFVASAINIIPFGQGEKQHIRDVSVVATNDAPDSDPKWTILHGRLADAINYQEDLTIPPMAKRAVVRIELENEMPFYTYGLASFSTSRGHRRNYLDIGQGIYVHEMWLVE